MKSIFLYLSLFILFTFAGCDQASPLNKQRIEVIVLLPQEPAQVKPIQNLLFDLAKAGFNEYEDDEDQQAARKVKLYFMATNQEGWNLAMDTIETAKKNYPEYMGGE